MICQLGELVGGPYGNALLLPIIWHGNHLKHQPKNCVHGGYVPAQQYHVRLRNRKLRNVGSFRLDMMENFSADAFLLRYGWPLHALSTGLSPRCQLAWALRDHSYIFNLMGDWRCPCSLRQQSFTNVWYTTRAFMLLRCYVDCLKCITIHIIASTFGLFIALVIDHGKHD